MAYFDAEAGKGVCVQWGTSPRRFTYRWGAEGGKYDVQIINAPAILCRGAVAGATAAPSMTRPQTGKYPDTVMTWRAVVSLLFEKSKGAVVATCAPLRLFTSVELDRLIPRSWNDLR
jgi:hypothetical protein